MSAMRVKHEVLEHPGALQQLLRPHGGTLTRNERLATLRGVELEDAARRLHDRASLVKEIAGEGGGAAKIPVRIGGFFVERIDLLDVLQREEDGARKNVAEMCVGLDAGDVEEMAFGGEEPFASAVLRVLHAKRSEERRWNRADRGI